MSHDCEYVYEDDHVSEEAEARHEMRRLYKAMKLFIKGNGACPECGKSDWEHNGCDEDPTAQCQACWMQFDADELVGEE